MFLTHKFNFPHLLSNINMSSSRSMRASTKARKTGDTLKLLGMAPRRTKEELAAEKAASRRLKKDKAQRDVEKELKRAAAIETVSRLEERIVEAATQANGAFPRNIRGTLFFVRDTAC